MIGTKEVKKLKLKRTTKPKPVAISPEYRPVEHRTLKKAGHRSCAIAERFNSTATTSWT